jgi:uncharacterized protein
MLLPLALARPACAEPLAGCVQEEITFACGEFGLVGDVLLPAGDGPHPVVVYVWGAGPTNRRAHIENSRVLRAFLEHGYGVFLYDKPGSGGSTGRLSSRHLFRQRADILQAALRTLREHPAVDPGAVGLYGSSQAAYVLAVALADLRGPSAPAFLVAWSCPMQDSIRQSAYLVRNYLLCEGYGRDDALASERAYVRRGEATTYAEYEAAARHLDGIPPIRDGLKWAGVVAERHFTPADTLNGESFLDPARMITSLDMPTLALFAANDLQIDPVQGAAVFRRLVAASGDQISAVVTIPGADHNMILSPRGCMQDQQDRYLAVGGMTLAPEFLSTIDAWLERLQASGRLG